MMATAAFESVLPSIVPFPVPRGIQKLLNRVLGIEQIARVYDQLQARNGSASITDRLLDFFEISYLTSPADMKHIPENGAAVVAVNHPFGILDGAILASLLTKVRPDV